MSERTRVPAPGRDRLFKALLLVASLVFALGAGEVACRLVLPPPGFQSPQTLEPAAAWTEDAVRGHRYTPGFDTIIEVPGRRIRFAIDSLGMRHDPRAARGTGVTILAVGNSFTMGWRTEIFEAWPDQLERHLQRALGPTTIDVLNAGVSGYSLRQIRQAAEHFTPLVQPDMIIVGIYGAGFDRIRNPFVLLHGAPFRENTVARVRPVRGGFVQTKMHRAWMRELDFWLATRIVSASYAFRLSYDAWSRLGDEEAAPPARATTRPEEALGVDDLARELEAIRDYASARDVPVVAFLISEQTPDGTFRDLDRARNAAVAARARAAGIPVHDATPALEAAAAGEPVMRFDGDGHWTAAAHAVAARGLYDFLVSEFRFDTRTPRVQPLIGPMVHETAMSDP